MAKRLFAILVLLVFCLPLIRATVKARLAPDMRQCVVKIYATMQREDFTAPWQGGHRGNGTGSGFILSKRRILTNAHVVSDTRFLQVQKSGDPRRYDARVRFIAHDCDLAMIEVKDPAFFDGTAPLKLAEDLPRLNDEVTVVGYPMGGARMSITKGVVSRIDYSAYSHSGVDQHLVLQVDAAINPGNSGGPIMFDERVVGVAFQGLSWGDDIGYGIPIPVLRHFLKDVEDGAYDGYPELGVAFLSTQNPAMRKSLGLDESNRGVVLYNIDPFGSAYGLLHTGDVLLGIDGHDIAHDGTVELDGTHVIFAELMERKQSGESIQLRVLRDGAQQSITVPLQRPDDPFIYRMPYDERIPYHIIGGLVFTPLNRGYLNTLRADPDDSNAQQLIYYSQYAKVDGLHSNKTEFVILQTRLPHPVNTYHDPFINGVVEEVNGAPINALPDLIAATADTSREFHVVRFAGMDDLLVLDAAAAQMAGPQILNAYGVPAATGNLQ